MSKEQIGYYAILSLGIVAGGIIILVIVKYLFPVLLPFLIAWFMAMATCRPSDRLSKRTRIPARILRLMTSLLLTVSVFLLISLALWQLTMALWRFLSEVGEGNKLYDFLSMLTSPRPSVFGDGISEELAARITEAVDSLINSAMTRLGEVVTSVMGAVPNAFLFLIVTVISLIYFSLDLERINAFCRAILPVKISRGISQFREAVFVVIKRYITSYLSIMLITYITVLAGFLLLRIDHAMLIALAVAILDVLPVIGVGTVLIPWSIVEIALGNKFTGIGLLALFIVNTVIRQLAEPKIVGKSLDMHPIVTLILLYVGYRILGFAGLVLLPIIAVSLGVILKKDNTPEIG